MYWLEQLYYMFPFPFKGAAVLDTAVWQFQPLEQQKYKDQAKLCICILENIIVFKLGDFH